MIKPGLVSATFRQLSCRQIIGLVRETGLKCVEWGGDVHVPHGDIAAARRIYLQMQDAGLETAAYGSYYRLGKSEQEGLSFSFVLETAEALETSLIRVWAGDRNAEEAEDSYKQQIIEESRRIADLAASKKIRIAYEFHENTLTNTAESCQDLLTAVDHPYVGTYWQPSIGRDMEQNIEDIRILLPWLVGFHVFHWGSTPQMRHLLKTGSANWLQYFHVLRKADSEFYGLLEFVKDDDVENFKEDAATFLSLLDAIQKNTYTDNSSAVQADCFPATEIENL